MGGASVAGSGASGWPDLRAGARRGGLHDLDGVVDVGQLNLQAAHEDSEIADRLSEGAQFAGHFIDAGGQADHRSGDLVGLVAQVFLEVAGDHRHAGIGLIGGIRGAAGRLEKCREFLVLRLLKIFDVLLQQGDIPLQFLDFLVGARRERGNRN